MVDLSAAARIEKNKLTSDGVYLVLLDVYVYGTDINFHLVRNTEDITYKNQLYQAFPFTVADIKNTSDGEIPEIKLQVSNVNRMVQTYVEQANGGGKSTVTLRVVNSNLLDDEPLLEEKFSVTKTSCNENWVTFTLGLAYKNSRRPLNRYMKNYCNFKYCSAKCGCPKATSVKYPTCGHTLADCRLRGNSARFGGFPFISSGLYI